jgi:hypothetical protein
VIVDFCPDLIVMSTALLPGAGLPDYNRGPLILGTTISVTILAFLSVCARIWVRVRMIHSTGPDVSILVGLLCIN